MNKTSILLIVGFVVLAVVSFAVYMNTKPVAAAVENPDGEKCSHADNYMECFDESAGCKHRTCSSGWWGDWTQFNDPAGGSYSCASNTNGGGQKCAYKKDSVDPV